MRFVNKVDQTADQLRRLLARGGYAIGTPLPPLRDLIELCGVSLPTVRAAVARLAEEGLLESRHGSGTYIRALPPKLGPEGVTEPTWLGGGLACGRTLLVVRREENDMTSRWHERVEYSASHAYQRRLDGLIVEANRCGLEVSLLHCPVGEEGRSVLEKAIADRDLFGVVLHAPEQQPGESICLARGVPYVVFGGTKEGGSAQSPRNVQHMIRVDEVDAVCQAVRHLAEQGHRRIAFVGSSTQQSGTQFDRCTGYLRAIYAEDLPLDRELIQIGWLVDEPNAVPYRAMVRQMIDRLLALEDRPTALYLAGVATAMHAVADLQRRGVKLPQEMAFAVFDDAPVGGAIETVGEYSHPSWTRSDLPLEQMGREAVHYLGRWNHLGEPRRGCHMVLSAGLMVRESSAPPAAELPRNRNRPSRRRTSKMEPRP